MQVSPSFGWRRRYLLAYDINMDTRTLSYAVALVGIGIALLTALMAVFRKERGLTVYAVGFASAIASFLLFMTQGYLHPWFSIILANLLLIFYQQSLAWGLRICGDVRPHWPRRYWLYLPVWATILILGTLVWNSYLLRASVSSVFIILLGVEFLIALERIPKKPAPVIRRAAWGVLVGFMACHAIRIVLTLQYSVSASVLMDNNQVNSYSFSFSLVFSILLVGVLLITDAAMLLEELQWKNRILNDMATTDELTGLSNRHLLESKIQAEMGRAARYQQSLSLILFDLDHFKRVNDTWGHQTGDEVLKRTAGIIKGMIREPDNLFRWGGEEFIILAPHTSLAGAVALAEKVRSSICADPFPVVGTVSASFGVAEWRQCDSREQWFKQVDHALYRAKNAGRNRVVSFGASDMMPIAFVRMEWQTAWESGNVLIDDQHRKLMEMSNHLLDLSLSSASQEALRVRLDALLSHVLQHFADEEQVLTEIAYPGAANHAQLHRVLVGEALELKGKTEDQGGDPTAFFNFLVGKVIMGHLLAADVQFFPWTRKKGCAE